MQKLMTASEMRELDQMTIEKFRIPGLVLMENAGLGVTVRVEEILRESGGAQALIFCGRGNNGGDGFVAARHLMQRGYDVTVALACDPKKIIGDALTNFVCLNPLGIPVQIIHKRSDTDLLPDTDLIVDALLGTGVSGEITGMIAECIQWINASDLPVVSADLPSGLQADTGRFEGACVCAHSTVTMGELKRGLVLSPGRDLAGIVDVLDIGIPRIVIENSETRTFLVEMKDAAEKLPERSPSAHKGDFGKVAVFAGSRGMTGAAALCSNGALRAGAGLAVLGCPVSLNDILESKLTEVMTRPFSETESGSLTSSAFEEAGELLNWADVIALGPGLSIHPDTVTFMRNLIAGTNHPLVLDADGINAFSGHQDLIKKRDRLILTPHPGELAGLIGRPVTEIIHDPIESAREIARDLKCVLVLKGAPTVIATPSGDIYVNGTGNDGMATAGAGDVLTGIIAGLLAQGADPEDAAICGVYVHGLAGDLAAEYLGQSLMAEDIVNHVGPAIKQLKLSNEP